MPPAPPLEQLFWLFVLAIPVAAVVRTVVYEEVFRELREWCKDKSSTCGNLFQRKFFYVFTCEYCFSHWVAVFFLVLTRFKLLLDDWRGYVIAWFALVFVANIYLNFMSRLRVEITSEKKQIEKLETEIEEAKDASEQRDNKRSSARRRAENGKERPREPAAP